MQLGLLMQFYDIVITDMYWPFMWPSSGLCSHHVSGRNVSIHLLVFFKSQRFSRKDIHPGFYTTDYDSELWLHFKTRKIQLNWGK